MFDALETAPLIETGQAPLLLPPADSAEGPTLQDALGAKQDAIPADLWHAGTVPSDNPGPGDPGSSQLRPLRPDELLLIAGGNGSEISVWGPDPEPEPDWEWWNDDSPSNDYDPVYCGNGGGDGGGDSEPEANPTPCVEASPAGVSLQAMNNAALAASNAIAARDDEHFEYSSIIWSLNGTVGSTTPYTNGLPGEVNWLGGLSQVPAGAVIVGIVHNHPDRGGATDERIPSGGLNGGDDWGHYNQLVDQDHAPNFGRGITADPNALLYIYTNKDHKTHVYDNTDKNQINPGCSLQ